MAYFNKTTNNSNNNNNTNAGEVVGKEQSTLNFGRNAADTVEIGEEIPQKLKIDP